MKPTRGTLAALALAGVTLALAAAPMHAQFTKRLTQAVQSDAENRAIQKVVEHENKAIDAALADGRVTLQGVGFKEGTADITDGSAPSLKALGAMLSAHGDVRLRLEAYASSKDVAVARGQAIRDAMVKAYAVDAGGCSRRGSKARAGKTGSSWFSFS